MLMTKHMQRTRFGALLMATALLATVVGCGGGDLQPVKGKVVYGDGTPVPGGSITFNNSEKQLSASGDIAQDGTFSLRFGDYNGAPPGVYKVVVTGSSDTYGAPPSVAPIYGDPQQTPLTQTISAGQGEIEIKVERP
jgi:hypothetical protein